MKTKPSPSPMVDLLNLFDAHMEALHPKNKPTKEKVAAARATATIGNTRLAHLKLTMEYARLGGRKPDMRKLLALPT